jgi:hypothetical protein
MMNILSDLRREHIAPSSLATYLNTIVSFLTYLNTVDPASINLLTEQTTLEIDVWVCPLTAQIKEFFANLDAETPPLTVYVKKQRLKTLLSFNNLMPVVNFNLLKEHHLILFVLSLQKKDGGTPGYSTFNTHRAGFNHLFRMYRQKQPDVMGEELSLYFRSLKKREAKRAQEGIGQIHSTKLPLPFEVYRLLSGSLLEGAGASNRADAIQNIFGHTFWILSWNIMARSVNTANISLRHLDWSGDALHVYVRLKTTRKVTSQSFLNTSSPIL